MNKMIKRLIAISLAFVLLMSLCPVGYASDDEPAVAAVSISSDGTVEAGTEETFTVSIANNPGIAGFVLEYVVTDSNGNDVTSSFARSKDEYGDWTSPAGVLVKANGIPIGSYTTNGVYLNWNYSANITGDGSLFTMNLIASTDLVDGDYTIVLKKVGNLDKNFCNEVPDAVPVTFEAYTFTLTGAVEKEAVTPSITDQPVSAAYSYGDTATALSVSATVETEGELTYQWFKNNAEIENATGATFIPALTEYGTAYYYCVVTNTYNSQAYTATSKVAAITYSKADQPEFGFTSEDTVTYGNTLTLNATGGSGTGAVTYTIKNGTGAASVDGSTLTPTAVGEVTVTAVKAADDNYNAANAQQTVTINPAELTLEGTTSYDVFAYTTRNPVALTVPTVTAKNDQTVTSAWTVTSGEDWIALNTNGTVTVTAAESAKADDTATVTLTYSAPNHNNKVITYNITIKDKNNVSDQMTFTPTSTASATYDATAKSVDTFVNAATIAGSYTGTITYTVKDSSGTVIATNDDLSALQVTNAGIYTVTATYSDDENEGARELTFTIDRAEVAEPTAKTGLVYTGSSQVGVTYTPGIGYTMSGTLSAANAGEYTATATLDDNHQWSDGTTAPKTIIWSISQATIDVSNWTWDYTGPFTYEKNTVRSVALQNSDQKVNIVYSGNSATDAGEYTATAALSVKTEYQQNYKLSDTELTQPWVIDQKTINVTGASWNYDGPYTYDGQEKTVTVTGVDTTEVSVSYTNNAKTDADTYIASATFSPVDSKNCKVTGTIENLEWTIRKAVVEVPAAAENLIYNGSAQTGVAFADTDAYTVENGTAVNADRYTATASLKDQANYEWKLTDGNSSDDQTISWSIAKKSATLADQTNSLRYSNTAAQTFTASDIKALLGDSNSATTVTITEVSTTDANAILAADAESTASSVTYALKSGLAAADKDKTAEITVSYESNNYVNGTVKLTVRVMDKQDVSGKISFVGGSGVYTGTAQTYEQAAMTDPSLTGTITYTYSGTMTNAGAYTVTATYEDADNYGQKSVTYTINKAQLTINGGTVDTKTYDGTTDAAVSTVNFTGLVNDEALSESDYTVTNASFNSADVKSAGTVTFTVALNDTDVTKNYELTSASGSAAGTITPKTVAVILDGMDAQTYTGSALEPAVTVSATGTIGNYVLIQDTDYTVAYSGNTNVGSAAVTVSPKAGSNYTFDEETANFTINKADPVVTADNLTVVYTGEAIPASKISGTALFNGLAISGTWSWVAEPAGTGASETAYTAEVKFTPDNANLNESAALPVTVTITKATPTGEPAFEKINTSGMTLADVKLETGTITPAGGTIKWVDADGNELSADTKVEANKAYTWVYIPADPDNYNELTGTITLYVYISYTPILGSTITAPDAAENGAIQLSTVYAIPGAKVVITATPDEGYEVATIEIRDNNGNLIPVTDNGDGTYSFVMPTTKVSVSATFTEIKEEPAEPTEPTEPTEPVELPFTDVADNAWYLDAVQYAYENGLMNGTSATAFSPDVITTRGMIVTILYRLEGEPGTGTAAFTDVAAGTWYTDAVAWASANGIVNGYGDNTFGPEDPITREQMAAILYRYAAYKGCDVTAQANLSGYTDAAQISGYATAAMSWANAEGLITGVTTATLVPLGNATRAEVATILMRFIENVAK